MELREMTIRDRKIITELFRDVFTNEPWNDDWSDAEQLDAYISDLIGQSYSLTLGYFDTEQLVGLSMGYVKHWYSGTEYLIDEFCVARRMQGQGIGSSFLKAIEAYLSENGIYRIFLQTEKDMPAYTFYLHHGFNELTGHVSFAKSIAADRRKVIAACGNDCSVCPRYTAHPYEKTEEELHGTAELWMKIGYRDHVVSNEEISCTGCKPDNWCRYRVARCCGENGIKSCAECGMFPCGNLKDCFAVTESFEPKCRQVCSEKEYARLKEAFFEKEQNLRELRRIHSGMDAGIDQKDSVD